MVSRVPGMAIAALIASIFTHDSLADIPLAERNVLLTLYSTTGGDHWFTSTGWDGAAGTECSWYGITCDASNSHVTEVNLYSNGLSGPMPALNGLPELTTIYLEHNVLTGAIPPFKGLSKLSAIYLDDNKLMGSLPSFNDLPSVGVFSVSDNQLSGSIPSFNAMTNVGRIYLDHNQLTGPLPPLTGLHYLYQIYVYYNRLSGNVPAVATVPLYADASGLCPNQLNRTSDPNWDLATGSSPWYANCDPNPIFNDDFESQ